MANIFDSGFHRFPGQTNPDLEYAIQLDAALAKMFAANLIDYTLSIMARNVRTGEETAVEAQISLDIDHGVGFLSVEGARLVVFDLGIAVNFGGDEIQSEEFAEIVDTAINAAVDNIGVVGAIDSFPAALLGDPITACLMKGGLSTTVEQAIRCDERNRELRERMWLYVKSMFSCFRQAAGEMLDRGVRKAIWCMARAGLG